MTNSLSTGAKFWIRGAEEALKSATVLLDSGMHLHSLFFCHLAIEKILKAAVQHRTKQVAPKTHNLMYLLKLSDLSPSDETVDFLGQLNTFNVPTRYPDELPGIEEMLDRRKTQDLLEKTRNALQWTKESIIS